MAAAVFLITYPRRARSYSHITLKVPPIAPRVSHVANPRACQCVTCAVVALAWLLLVTAFFLGLGGASIGPAQERAADTEQALYRWHHACATAATCFKIRMLW